MKTFEEKWTAWLDGELTGAELAEFESALPDKAAAEVEKQDAKKLGAFLKEQLQGRAMGNEEFFHHQLRERIASDARAAVAPEKTRPSLWPLRRLVWAGATSLAIFLVCAVFVMRENSPTDQSQYLTHILNARVDPVVNPNATISMFEANEDRVTVLWVEGLQSLPSEYATK
jgi:anti-sigma factor RsiW